MEKIPHTIVADDYFTAWKEAYYHVYSVGRKRLNLVVFIRNASLNAANQHDVIASDPALACTNTDHVYDVANTIFPDRSEKWNLPVDEFCTHYKKAYSRLLAKGRRSWGCYFLRLIDFNKGINQLQRIVHALTSWSIKARTAYVVHFSSADTEKPKKLGAPCLQYVQFGYDEDGRLCLTAVYRSHDYFSKALGNYIGLSRMLEYVAHKAMAPVGSITCYSSYAFIDKKISIAEKLFFEGTP